MEPFCSALDATGAIGYLETDRAENVDFYRPFGFEVIGRAPIHGVVNCFMARRPQVKPENIPAIQCVSVQSNR
jgi:hypothetical protein